MEASLRIFMQVRRSPDPPAVLTLAGLHRNLDHSLDLPGLPRILESIDLTCHTITLSPCCPVFSHQ